MLLHPYIQSIAHINDSATFESSFEVKHIQTTPLRQKNDCYSSKSERENLRRFVAELEHLQACNSSAKSTPKTFKKFNRNLVNIGNTGSRSLCQTLQWAKDNLEQNNSSSPSTLSSFCSNRSNSPNPRDLDMAFKPLATSNQNENEDEPSLDESVQLCESANENISANTSYAMHAPLLPSFNVTPPKQQQRNAAYELARFLRGSFHVKRAKITHLRRSLSDNENLQNVDLPPAQIRCNTSAKKDTSAVKVKRNVLEDTTNHTRGSTSNICTRLFPGNTSPFRRVWEQSSLRTPRSDKYALSTKQNSPGSRCSDSMIASESNVFAKSTTAATRAADPKTCLYNKPSSPNAKMPMRSQSEKLTNCTENHGVKSWANSFEHLLQEPAALATFAEFLKLEFSAENIYFWTSCERYRNTDSLTERQIQARQIYCKYLANGCREPVNLDSQTRNLSEEMLNNAEKNLFVTAQKQIFHLMKFDSFQRFIRSDLYKNCLQAEEKGQLLPYGAENLDAQLKINFLPSASPKLKKSASNAEDRRRKIVLPWHRKTRSKSRDRIDGQNDENEASDSSTNGLNTLLVPSSKLALLSSTLPPQAKSTMEYADTQIQSLRSSLPTSLKAGETVCSLCRVKFCDGATTIVQIKPNETIQQLVERVLEKRGLRYKLYEVVIKGQSKAIDLHASTQEIAGEEVEIEQRITFKLYLPDPKVISVKSKPKKFLYEVVIPILQKYNYDLVNVDILRRDNQEKIDLNQLVTTADGLRLQVILHKNNVGNSQSNNNMQVNYQNDNISMNWFKSKELANEIVARNYMGSSLRNNIQGSQSNLDTITNSIFCDIIEDKAKPESTLQTTDQYSIKSDECSSEASTIFGTLNSKNDAPITKRLKSKPNCTSICQNFTDAIISSNSSQTSNEFNKPIIAKLKAGVKLQLTERVAEKQDELLISLKTRLDTQSIPNAETKSNGNEIDQITPLSLRLVRANLSPVNKTNPCNELNKSLDKPKPLVRHSINNKKQESPALIESKDPTKTAADKGPPPLPPKPKVLPTKPSNWGFNISDQTTLQ